MSHEQRFADLGLTLPPAPKAIGRYSTIVEHGGLVYTSGHAPLKADGSYVFGKVGGSLDLAAGREAARLTGLSMLSSVRAHLGSLDRVTRILRVLGMVNATPELTGHPFVIDGFSELMVQVFGDCALAARSAVGVGSLPGGIAVEIEATFAVS